MLFKRLTLTLIAILGLSALALALAAPVPAAAQEDEDYTYLRITHLSYASGGLDVYIDGQPSEIQAVRFGDISGWAEMSPGTYSITFVPVGANLDAAVLGPYNYTLDDDSWTTLAVTGVPEEGTLAVHPLRMDYTDINQGDARVAVFHGIYGAPAVDVVLEDDTVLVEDLPYVEDDAEGGFEAGMATVDVAAATYTVSLVPTGETEPVLLTLEELELEPATFYFIAAGGTPEEPVPVLSAIAIDEINTMTNASIGEGDTEADDMDSESEDDVNGEDDS